MPSRPTFGRYGDSSSSSLGRNTLVAPKLSSMKRGLADMKRRTTGMLDQITGGAVETDEEWERRQRREAAAAAASGSGSRRGGGAAAVTSRFVDPADASYRYKSDDRVEEEEFAFGNNEVKCRSCKMIYADRNGLQAHYRLFPVSLETNRCIEQLEVTAVLTPPRSRPTGTCELPSCVSGTISGGILCIPDTARSLRVTWRLDLDGR